MILGRIAPPRFSAGFTAAALADEVKLGYINKMGEHPGSSPKSPAPRRKRQAGAKISTQDVQFNADLDADDVRHDGRRRRAGRSRSWCRTRRSGRSSPRRRPRPISSSLRSTTTSRPQQDDGAVYRHERRRDRRAGRAGGSAALQGAGLGPIRRTSISAPSRTARPTPACGATNGAEAAFLEAVPGFDKANIVRIPYDNTMDSAIDAVTTTLTANPEAQHWIFFSCNDDGVLGAVRATENQGMKPDQVIGIGIDGSRSCSVFGTGSRPGSAARCISTAARRARRRSSCSSHRSRTRRRCREDLCSADLINADNLHNSRTSSARSDARSLETPPRRQALRRGPGAGGRHAAGPRGRDPGAGGRERRRQVHADAHRRRRAIARLGRPSPSTARPSPARAPDAHAPGIRVIHQEPDIAPDLRWRKTSSSATFAGSTGYSSIAADLARRLARCWRASGSTATRRPGSAPAISAPRIANCSRSCGRSAPAFGCSPLTSRRLR